MNAPSAILAVDTAALIALVLGGNRTVIERVAHRCKLVTSTRALSEARRRLELGLGRPELLQALQAFAGEITVEPDDAYAGWVLLAEEVLKNAVPSRNGSGRDAHILALAWASQSDIWSPDRDFAGTGVASWSTPNLLRALASR